MNRNFPLLKLENPNEITPHKTIGKRMFYLLRQAIVQQRLRPGNLLSEADVAKQMGTSRQPVREAFIKLADIGLVEVKPQRGTFVTLISEKEVENARFIRKVVEVAIVRRVAIKIQDKDIADLQKLVEEQKKVDAAHDYPHFLQLDEEFHVRIFKIIGFSRANHILENPKTQIDRVRYLSLPDEARANKVVGQHQSIVDALVTRSPDVAATAMALHLAEIINSLPSVVSSNPDLFLS